MLQRRLKFTSELEGKGGVVWPLPTLQKTFPGSLPRHRQTKTSDCENPLGSDPEGAWMATRRGPSPSSQPPAGFRDCRRSGLEQA